MHLPQHVQSALGITTTVSKEDLIANDSVCQFAQTCFGLSSEEFALAIETATEGNTLYSIQTARRGLASWKHLDVSLDGSKECECVYTPENISKFPSTAASQVLVGAWFSDSSLINSSSILTNRIIIATKTGLAARTFSVRFLEEWSKTYPLYDSSLVPPVWISKGQLLLTSASRLLANHSPNLRFQDLFIEAVSEVKTKWRFLSLYRIFEHGYLSEVFNTLRANFFASPKDSLADATLSLESEINQFLALAQHAKLESNFVLIHDEFQKIVASGNRFAAAIEHSFKKDKQLKSLAGKDQKGVLICYKIRCAIVHAGASSLIFDAYTDAHVCLETLLPFWESTVLQFLEVEVVD